MREMLRYGLTLMLICSIAAGLLAGINSLTKPKIIAQARLEEEASLKKVIPEGFRFEPIKEKDDIIYYKAYDEEGKLIGLAFKASGKGYSSTIETMVAMALDGTISTIKILSQNETPGVGSQIAEPGFAEQFRHKNTQNLDEIQAITGATISSRAVIDSVKVKAKEIQKLIKDVPKNE